MVLSKDPHNSCGAFKIVHATAPTEHTIDSGFNSLWVIRQPQI